MSISKLHQTARSWAANGIAVFPCLPNAKAPATENGFKDATTDLSQIDAWWTENPNYNVALNPHQAGWGVVDVDGPEGAIAWAELKAERDIPNTYEVRTPRGGSHLYFEGELPMTAWSPGRKRCLGEHIDTRGVGSYVLIPPSVVDGKAYEVIHDRDFAVVPGWMQTKLAAPDRSLLEDVSDALLDDSGNVGRGRDYLASLVKQGAVAVSGSGGNNFTRDVALRLRDLGLSAHTAYDALDELFNPHCLPPWPQEELRTIVANAYKYAQNPAGVDAVAPASEVFSDILDKLSDLPPEQPAQRSRFYFEDETEQDEAKLASWLVRGLIVDNSTVLIVGPKGNFKSFIAHELVLAIAAGISTFGELPDRSGPCFYGAHEGAAQLKRERRQAWRIAREIDRPVPIFVAPAPRVASQEECDEFRAQIRARLATSTVPIAGIVLDTVAKCMVGLDENNAADMGRFVAFCDLLVYEFQCPVIALHHTKKDGTKGSRGSGALEAGFSTVLDVERSGKSKNVAVSVRYHKDAEEPERPWHFEGRVVGPSLVFFPISGADYKSQTLEDDPFSKTHVGAALRVLGAIGPEEAVSTAVLALQLTPGFENESHEAHTARVKKSERILGKLSQTKLEAYCDRPGRELLWFMPLEETAPAK